MSFIIADLNLGVGGGDGLKEELLGEQQLGVAVGVALQVGLLLLLRIM